ncbi:hypothetical protein BLAT2472_40490 [Burkholderia latens]
MPRHRAGDRIGAGRRLIRCGAAAGHAARERANRLRRAGRRAGHRRAARSASGARRRADRERSYRRSRRGQSRRRDPHRPARGFELSRGAARRIREVGRRESRVRRAARAAARSRCARRAAVRDAVDAVAPAYARTSSRERRACVGALRRADRVQHRDRLPCDRARGRRLRATDGFLDRRRSRNRPARAAAARVAVGARRDSRGVSADTAAVAEGARVHRRDEGNDRRNPAGRPVADDAAEALGTVGSRRPDRSSRGSPAGSPSRRWRDDAFSAGACRSTRPFLVRTRSHAAPAAHRTWPRT